MHDDNKVRAAVAALCLVLGSLLLMAPSAHAEIVHGKDPGAGEVYYISMGDSMATGSQLDPESGMPHETNQGYTDQVYRTLRKTYPNLKHIRIGCADGETAATMISGGVCAYPSGNQLDEAVNFVEAHSGRVVLLTLNIGSNDVAFSGCLGIPDPAEQTACFQQTFQALGGNLGHILQRITSASRGEFPIVAANLNNKYLNSWLQGEPGKVFAHLSAQLELLLNSQVFKPLYDSYESSGVKVADLASAFRSQDFTTMARSNLPAPNNVLPLNVAKVCEYTYACPHPDSGLAADFHFNTAGYSVVAREFLTALRR